MGLVEGNQKLRNAPIDPLTEKAIRLFIDRLAGQYDMAGAILFGSRARQTHRQDSDADVAVLLHGLPGKFVATKLNMDDFAYEVLLETGICSTRRRKRKA
jgi:predicted nucleotidyltransferase